MPNIKDCERGPTSGLSASKGPLLGGAPLIYSFILILVKIVDLLKKFTFFVHA
jgi:hypothetical protein